MKALLNNLLSHLGYRIRATHAPLQSLKDGISALAPLIAVNTVIDIGVGRGTPELYETFPGKHYLLVEANPNYAGTAKRIAERLNGRAELVFCGAEDGTATLHLAGESSTKYPLRAYPTTEVPVCRLDTLVLEPGPYVLKIDVEGAELEVLKGAAETLKRTLAVIVELSFGLRPEAPSFEETVAFLATHGFRLHNICEGGGILEHGRLTHADFIFVKINH